jgi:adenylate cyclase, class 2
MSHLNFEFKAAANDIDRLEKKLLELDPLFIGEDHQVDTYFKVKQGRLKLREGNIENALIYYEREDMAGARQSNVMLYPLENGNGLKEILEKIHGILAVVDKRRKIYFIDNVKFHFDRVAGLGTFIEVEAIDTTGAYGVPYLKRQCELYAVLFSISKEDHIALSYCDLIIRNKTGNTK